MGKILQPGHPGYERFALAELLPEIKDKLRPGPGVGFLKPEHDVLRGRVREYAEERIRPIASEIDSTNVYPANLTKEIGQLGFIGACYPKEYSGLGLDTISWVIIMEEVARVSASVALAALDVQGGLAADQIHLFGSKEQKKRFLVPMLKGEKIGAFGLTEPGAGSDNWSMRTTARLDGDEWVLNGSKNFITQGNVADVVTILAVTGRAEGQRPKISSFIVERGTPGFETRKMKGKMMGMLGSETSEVFLEDCRIPRENMIGKEGEGFIYFLTTLDRGRISIAGIGLGIQAAAEEAAIHYAGKKPEQGKQFIIADMDTSLEAGRLLTYKAAALFDRWAADGKTKFTKDAAQAKLHTSEAAMTAASNAYSMLGEVGVEEERHPVGRLMRDAKLLEIGEGTSQIQRHVIARELLK